MSKVKAFVMVGMVVGSMLQVNFNAPGGAADTMLTNNIGMEFVLIPDGEFMMGTERQSWPDWPDEKPRHKVVITSFFLARTEVTQEQWYKVMGNNPAYFKTEKVGMDSRNHPVEQVSWLDAQEFIRRLNDLEGQDVYRLPTEAEWEYAARAGSDGDYYCGNGFYCLEEYGWYSDNSGGTTHPVGQKQPNAWGLYDMHGNVREWCQDIYVRDAYASHEQYDPVVLGKKGFKDRVLRGGSWNDGEISARSASREYLYPTSDEYSYIGFRLVRAIFTRSF